MNQLLITLLLLICSGKIFSQEVRKDLDFIIVIDEKISINSITNIHVKTVSDDSVNILNAKYYPGNLSIVQSSYDRLMEKTVNAIYLEFTYYEYIGKIQTVYTYEIELKKNWLKDDFNVLHIYNLNKKKYQMMFNLKEKEKKYVFELDSPNYTFQLLRK